jgi:hypothetical protein
MVIFNYSSVRSTTVLTPAIGLKKPAVKPISNGSFALGKLPRTDACGASSPFHNISIIHLIALESIPSPILSLKPPLNIPDICPISNYGLLPSIYSFL